MTSTRHPVRERGTVVRLLDLSTYEAEALEFGNAHRDDAKDPWTQARVDQAPMALGVDLKGTAYLIGTEGVGWPLGDDNEFAVYLSTETSFQMVPTVAFTLTREQVLDALGDEVDLADHVRVFGGRLEDNFNVWHATLNAS